MNDMDYITVSIPVHLWVHVDGIVDNSVAVDVVEADMESVTAGACVRDAGWRAAAGEPDRDQYGWPPVDHVLEITLRRAHWIWVLYQLDRWAPYTKPPTSYALQQLIDTALEGSIDND